MTTKPDQIRALEREAALAGDTAQQELCRAALRGDSDALAECAAVIDQAARNQDYDERVTP